MTRTVKVVERLVTRDSSDTVPNYQVHTQGMTDQGGCPIPDNEKSSRYVVVSGQLPKPKQIGLLGANFPSTDEAGSSLLRGDI